MRKEFQIIIISILFIILLIFGMFIADDYRMKNNLPVLFSTWGKKYAPVEPQMSPYETYKVIDRTQECAEALEYIASDEKYDYYLPCIQSETIFIVYDNGLEETLKVALAEGHITIESLMKHDVSIIKEAKNVINQNSISCNNADFEMSFYSDKKVYQKDEKINAYATFKYVGNDDTIQIWHASSYMLFTITDGKDFNVGGAVNMILMSSILNKNELYNFAFVKSGGYSNDEENASFWEQFYSEKDLMLPKGEYTIAAKADFALSSDMENAQSLICELKITVV